MKIQVTQGCIDEGERGDPYCCPVALAIRKVKGVRHIGVIGTSVVITLNSVLREYRLPSEAMKFIKAFDDAKPVYPFEFNLGNEELLWGPVEP